VGDVPHAPVRPALLAGKPGGQDARTAGTTHTLQQASRAQCTAAARQNSRRLLAAWWGEAMCGD
jgi:hypothetical protein